MVLKKAGSIALLTASVSSLATPWHPHTRMSGKFAPEYVAGFVGISKVGKVYFNL
jgi:hypothetical protein